MSKIYVSVVNGMAKFEVEGYATSYSPLEAMDEALDMFLDEYEDIYEEIWLKDQMDG